MLILNFPKHHIHITTKTIKTCMAQREIKTQHDCHHHIKTLHFSNKVQTLHRYKHRVNTLSSSPTLLKTAMESIQSWCLIGHHSPA